MWSERAIGSVPARSQRQKKCSPPSFRWLSFCISGNGNTFNSTAKRLFSLSEWRIGSNTRMSQSNGFWSWSKLVAHISAWLLVDFLDYRYVLCHSYLLRDQPDSYLVSNKGLSTVTLPTDATPLSDSSSYRPLIPSIHRPFQSQKRASTLFPQVWRAVITRDPSQYILYSGGRETPKQTGVYNLN